MINLHYVTNCKTKLLVIGVQTDVYHSATNVRLKLKSINKLKPVTTYLTGSRKSITDRSERTVKSSVKRSAIERLEFNFNSKSARKAHEKSDTEKFPLGSYVLKT